MSEKVELPKYKCHKEVWALKIKEVIPIHTNMSVSGDSLIKVQIVPEDEGYEPFDVPKEYYRKHKPQAGGYYVAYKGGYISYSPAQVFEEGYSRI